MSESAVALTGVSKRYPHFALQGIDLTLESGQILGFIGPNGAGKSTTLRILLGLVHQDNGEVRVLGYRMPAQQREAKLDVGFVSEDMRLYGGMTLAWHMQFVSQIYPAWDPAYAANLLQRFDLKAEQRIKGLSHGQRIKATMLLMLARRPRLVVLDEPTTGLDPVARQEVLRELTAVLIDESRTVLFSSHNTLDVEQIADRIAFIDRGRIIAEADKDSLLERWRRVRVDLAPDGALPPIAGLVSCQRSGRVAHLTIDGFDPATPAAWHGAGLTVLAVDRMTLEEIFLTRVEAGRAEVSR